MQAHDKVVSAKKVYQLASQSDVPGLTMKKVRGVMKNELRLRYKRSKVLNHRANLPTCLVQR